MITTRGTPSNHKMIPRMAGFLSAGDKSKNPCEGVFANVGGERLAGGEWEDARRSSLGVEPAPRAEVPPNEG